MDRSIADRLSSIAGRGACTDAERRAAAALHDELRSRGHEAWVEARWTRPQANASLLLHAALLVVASLASVALPVPAAAVAGVAALSLAIEAWGRTGPLRLLFVRRATQHVLTVPAAGGVALIVSAAYDAPRGGIARSPLLRRLATRLPGRPLTWIAGCAVIVAACAAARAAGLEGAWLGAVQLLPTLVLLLTAALAIDTMAAGWAGGAKTGGSPADEGASSAAVAVAVYEELVRQPVSALTPALLLHGAGQPGPQALRAHLRGEQLSPREALVLEVGPSGSGAPAWATRHSQVRDAARRAADALGVPARRGLRPPAGTGRLPAITVGAVDPVVRGDIDPAVMDAVLDLALAVVDALDADLAARNSPRSVNVG